MDHFKIKMRPGKLILGLTALLLFSSSRGQQNNVWYFGGGAGITFNPSGTRPVPSDLQDGQMSTFEGCSSIADGSGNILFYTNGRKVYTKNHSVMAGGDSLDGHPSAFQAAVIIRKPDSKDIFYLFTADALEHNWASGYKYNIVDMSRNGGLGQVVNANIPLYAPGSERLTAARHANGIDVWVITNDKDSDVFRAYLVTCNGVQPTPVVSTTGASLNQFPEQNIGSIKVSPDGKHLCQTQFPPVIDILAFDNDWQLFDFNNLTGVISNPKLVRIPNVTYNSCEFSPDSKLLYITSADYDFIDQYNCTAPTLAGLIASRISIPAAKNFHGIQLGPDKKIYTTNSSQYLSVIANPNNPGIGCNFQFRKVPLFRSANIGLPSFLNDLSFDPNNFFTMQILDTCLGRIQFNAQSGFIGGVQYSWDFGDGVTSTLQNPVHTFVPPTQVYTVKLKIQPAATCGYIERSQGISPRGVMTQADFDFTAVCDSGYVRFTNLSTIFPDTVTAGYLWDFGDGTTSTDTNAIHFFPGSGTFNVKLNVQTTSACLNSSKQKIINLELLNIQASPDQQINEGDKVQLSVTGGGSKFIWDPPTGLSDPRIPDPIADPDVDITYIVTASNDAGCIDTDTVFIKVIPRKEFYVPTAFTPNNDGKNDVFKPILPASLTLREFSVYSRWGQRLYSTTQKDAGWNGKVAGINQDPGIYIWIVNVADRRGNKQETKGTFVLLR